MSEAITISSIPANYSTSTKTNELRFIMREGKQVLQQASNVINYENGFAVSGEIVWNDVPLIEEITNDR